MINQRRTFVNHRRSFSSLPARYDDFLFAPVCDDSNGMRVSVLSALARMDVDPWEEAGRLATMPRATAARLLASMLDAVFDKAPGAGAIAGRLVRLLPSGADAAAQAGADEARPGSQPAKTAVKWKSFWWIWVGFAVAITIMSPRQPTTPVASDLSASQSSATTVHDAVVPPAGDPTAPPAQ